MEDRYTHLSLAADSMTASPSGQFMGGQRELKDMSRTHPSGSERQSASRVVMLSLPRESTRLSIPGEESTQRTEPQVSERGRAKVPGPDPMSMSDLDPSM